MPLPQFIDYTAKIIGYSVITLLPMVLVAKLFFSLAHNARRKVDLDCARNPFKLDEFEVKLGDDMIVTETGELEFH